MRIVHVQWEGPLTQAQVANADNGVRDRGLYEISGSHPVYGHSTLLYIGRTSAEATTFAARIKQHDWRFGRDLAQEHLTFYLGRLAGSTTPPPSRWNGEIECVEALLVAAHKPAWDSSGVLDLGVDREARIGDLHILNWGTFGYLLPEVSAARWCQARAEIPNYGVYGSHERAATR
jgi:hypothetical protein